MWPIFVTDSRVIAQESIASLPGIGRVLLDQLDLVADRCRTLGITTIAIFPVLSPDEKDEAGSLSHDENGIVPRAVKKLKSLAPELTVICDIALDPFTSHGQDGVIDADGNVLNDKTISVLVKQAITYAEAGADVIAPSDMMDGRVGAIRKALEAAGHSDVAILSYSAKYASNLYGPFRDAVKSPLQSGADKASYQMSATNAIEALRECDLDEKEGADMLMIKPAGWYLDILYRVSSRSSLPVLAYQVSGEYAMIKQLAAGDRDREMELVIESLTSIKRAGARAIFTYFAPDVAAFLRNG